MIYKKYKRAGLSEMTTAQEYKDETGGFEGVSVSTPDKLLLQDVFMQGYIARNPANHEDKWYVSKEYFDANLEPATEGEDLNPPTSNAETPGVSPNQPQD